MKKEEKSTKKSNGSIGAVRAKIQELLQENMRTPIGLFHGKELSETSFLNDLFKNFTITPKKSA
jgi:hypothetical protein